MTNSIIPFQFEEATIRTVVVDDGEILFVAKDIAEALGYTWNGTQRIEHVPAEWRGVTSVVTPSGIQEMAVLYEQGVYFFLGRSDKPAALPMQKWVAGDVLPSIRKTGKYETPKAPKVSRARDPDPIILQLRRADAIISSTIRAGRLLGTEPAMARAIAVDEARRETGIDYQKLLANNSVEEAPVNPTELGKEQGWTAKQTNLKLEAAGFQYKDDTGQWLPTETGKPFCTVNPYKSPNSSHTGYRVLWFRRVLDALLRGVAEPHPATDNVIPMRGAGA